MADSPVTGAVLLAVLLVGLYPGGGLALPPDPQRPFMATSCDAAMIRLHEALAGSPLISAAEMAEVTALACAQAERLCGADAVKEMVNGPGDLTVPAVKGDCTNDSSD
jgi:hypothetical protein